MPLSAMTIAGPPTAGAAHERDCVRIGRDYVTAVDLASGLLRWKVPIRHRRLARQVSFR